MEKQLKKICMKKRLPAIIILFIAAIALLVLWLPDLFLYMKGPAQLSDLTVDELSGAYVEAHIEGIYDWYAQDVETSGSSEKIVAREYLIPVGEYEYMSLYAPEKYLSEADALMEETQAYLMDPSSQISGSITVAGTILPMEDESLQFYHEYLEYDSMDAQTQALFLPLYLRVDYVNETPLGRLFFLTGAGAALFLAAVIVTALTVKNGGCKELKKFLEQSGDPAACEAKLDHFYETVPEVNGVRANGSYIMFWSGSSFHIVGSEKVLWAYIHRTAHKLYGIIKIGVTNQVVLRTDTGKAVTIGVRSEAAGQEILEYIERSVNHIIVGYTDELNQLFMTDIEGFKQVCRQKESGSSER